MEKRITNVRMRATIIRLGFRLPFDDDDEEPPPPPPPPPPTVSAMAAINGRGELERRTDEVVEGCSAVDLMVKNYGDGNTAKGEVEVTMELEEDVFFADLSKQISLLIMDDGEEDTTTRCPPVSLQAFSHANHPSVFSPLLYEPACGRESKGTGVFIPRSSLLRRKNRQARYTSFNSKSCKQPDKSKEATHVTYKNDPSCNSFNSKKG
ncbi:hypothetical protein NE237_015595 [Protea cynaroides]|uniref:Uncharacterized protein n=1 Tax=Protea cynaroides TaxID=273540 RepID=A0A9Q0QRD2_9MAGN|nr:hypothetical protein NE237_015595 [Protea cynaroides]